MTDTKLFDSAYPIKIGDVDFQASMLTDRDYGDMDLYLQSRYINMSVKATELMDNPVLKQEIIDRALTNATAINWSSEEGKNFINTTGGIQQLGYLMIRKRHPRITLKEFIAEYNKAPVAAAAAISVAFRYLNIDTAEDSGGSSTGNNKSN